MKHLKLFEHFSEDVKYHEQVIRDIFQDTIDENSISIVGAKEHFKTGIGCYIDHNSNIYPLHLQKQGLSGEEYYRTKISVLFLAKGNEFFSSMQKIREECDKDLLRLESMGYKITKRIYNETRIPDCSFQYEIDYSEI